MSAAAAAAPLLVVNGAPSPAASPSLLMRWFVICMVGIGAGIQYTMRVDLSVAMTLMPKRYGWGGAWDGPLLSSFFVGYMIGNPLGALAARRFGGKRVLGFCVLGTGTLNFLIPIAARSPLAVCVLRVFIGLAQSGTFPCTVR